jgi:hypothetical protein
MLESGDTVLWLTPYAAIARGFKNLVYCWEQLGESCQFCFIADGKEIVALARSHEHLSEICDVFFACWQQASFDQ